MTSKNDSGVEGSQNRVVYLQQNKKKAKAEGTIVTLKLCGDWKGRQKQNRRDFFFEKMKGIFPARAGRMRSKEKEE